MTRQTTFEAHQGRFIALVVLYVLAAPLVHWLAGGGLAWWVAAAFSIVMNLVYPVQAVQTARHIRVEGRVALGFMAASLLGPLAHPLFVIGAIAGHGLWDWLKHTGRGVPFLRWYPPACAIFDFAYAAALLWFFLGL